MARFTAHKVSFVLIATSIAVGFGLLSIASPEASANSTTDLCIATGSRLPDSDETAGCVYTDGYAPVLASDVCWDGHTARVKGSAPCPGKQRVYSVKYGEVIDPIGGEIIAYAPLQNACELVPCAPMDDGAPWQEDGVACCDPETDDCWMPDANGDCPIGDITWCDDITPNDGDDTVTCHEE